MIEAVVADDDEIMRQVVCTRLRKWGIDVITGRNGNEAAAILQMETGPVRLGLGLRILTLESRLAANSRADRDEKLTRFD